MQRNGYKLVRKFDSVEAGPWENIPPMIEALGLRVMSAGPGWEDDEFKIVEATWEVDDPVAIVPASVSDRQFAQALKDIGVITFDEAMAFVQTGTIPALLLSVVEGIPDQSQKEAAQLLLAGAIVFERNHPMTEALGAGLGWSSSQIDDLWITASQL